MDGLIVAAVGTDWQDGISPWDFDLTSDRMGQDYYANLYTDRAIYRPGQTVYFKGVVRKDNDAEYSLPDLRPEYSGARQPIPAGLYPRSPWTSWAP